MKAKYIDFYEWSTGHVGVISHLLWRNFDFLLFVFQSKIETLDD